jgi:hypothetical protein
MLQPSRPVSRRGIVVLSSMTPPNSSIAVNHNRFLVECTANEVEDCVLFSLEIADLASENVPATAVPFRFEPTSPRERSPLDLREQTVRTWIGA